MNHAIAELKQDAQENRGLGRVLTDAVTAAKEPSPNQAKILERLEILQRRLATERFQHLAGAKYCCAS
jgi:hypothetical protein